MEPKKLPFVIIGVASTILFSLFALGIAASFPDSQLAIRDSVLVVAVIALMVASFIFSLYALITAFRDRNWTWFALIILSGAVAPISLILPVVYLIKVRRDSRASLPDPGWHHDPTAGHQLRYWNGSQWTEIVSDNGDTSIDPMPSAPGPSAGRRDTVAT